MKMTISVIIPTYQRVEVLIHCLEGLRQQRRQADEIVVVVRDTDVETRRFIEKIEDENLVMAVVVRGGMIAALNCGIQNSTGSILAFTDDDTVPHPDWLEQLEHHYQSDARVGGVGGRDIVHIRGTAIEPMKSQVGIIKPYGRIIGNHHIGMGNPRKVDVLKGANMSFRRQAIAGLWFDERLKGTGAQVHNELEFSRAVKAKGWKLIYDPQVCVDHFPAERFDEDQRNSFNETAFFNMAHNETYAMLKHASLSRRVLYLLWVAAVGSKSSPGLLQCLRMLPEQRYVALVKLCIVAKGRWGGWNTWKRSLG
ncbi:glycosyltransferase family 2 protein [Paenibacillus sp. JSM ZJ436]|uniref:glycosyltransferase family 2 protein n=1 Tax=Paenibacillus sp. JSM ZJ436 TaxID=3376190 RepID=UPI0037B30908